MQAVASSSGGRAGTIGRGSAIAGGPLSRTMRPRPDPPRTSCAWRGPSSGTARRSRDEVDVGNGPALRSAAATPSSSGSFLKSALWVLQHHVEEGAEEEDDEAETTRGARKLPMGMTASCSEFQASLSEVESGHVRRYPPGLAVSRAVLHQRRDSPGPRHDDLQVAPGCRGGEISLIASPSPAEAEAGSPGARQGPFRATSRTCSAGPC